MLSRRVRIGPVAGGVLLLAVGVVAYLLFSDASRRRAFDGVVQGMTESDVKGLLGRADERRSGCRDAPSWMGVPVSGECSIELVYYAHIGPIFWTVGLDRNGNVIAKYPYTSP